MAEGKVNNQETEIYNQDMTGPAGEQLDEDRACLMGTSGMDVLINLGMSYLKNRRPMLLAVSIGNPHFFIKENLGKLFCYASNYSDQVIVFV